MSDMAHSGDDHRLDPLICDLVEWVAREPRPYEEVMDAWRTSCPRLTVWEEATDRGLLVRESRLGGIVVCATPAGRAFVRDRRGARAT
ncbi:MAG: hypothetical protein AB7K67_06030 [Hyphomicrobiaceae bacterium]